MLLTSCWLMEQVGGVGTGVGAGGLYGRAQAPLTRVYPGTQGQEREARS